MELDLTLMQRLAPTPPPGVCLRAPCSVAVKGGHSSPQRLSTGQVLIGANTLNAKVSGNTDQHRHVEIPGHQVRWPSVIEARPGGFQIRPVCYLVNMTNRDSSVSSTPAPPAGDEALTAQKDTRKMPTLSPTQSRFYEGLARSSAFSLENIAKRANTKVR